MQLDLVEDVCHNLIGLGRLVSSIPGLGRNPTYPCDVAGVGRLVSRQRMRSREVDLHC